MRPAGGITGQPFSGCGCCGYRHAAVFRAVAWLRCGSRFPIPRTPDVRPRLIIAASPRFHFDRQSDARKATSTALTRITEGSASEQTLLSPIFDDGHRMIFEFRRAHILRVDQRGNLETRLVAVDPVRGVVGTKTAPSCGGRHRSGRVRGPCTRTAPGDRDGKWQWPFDAVHSTLLHTRSTTLQCRDERTGGNPQGPDDRAHRQAARWQFLR